MKDLSEDIRELYERNAEYFDTARRSPGDDYIPFEKEWFDAFLDSMKEAGSTDEMLTLLDMGCGGGDPVAKYFINQGVRVTGVDSSPSFIRLCKSRFPDHEWLLGDMRNFSVEKKFHGVIAWDSFFHLSPTDQRNFLQGVGDYLVPGGALMFTCGYEDGVRIGDMNGDPLYHASLSPTEYEFILRESGFETLKYREDDPGCGYHTIRLCRYY